MNTETEKKLNGILKETFRIKEFRSSQKKIISTVLSGSNALVLMPTGMGKSLCYQLPALMLPGLTIVISPLIALMKDQCDSLLRLEIDAGYINSSLSKSEREKRYRYISEGRYKIIFVSPERFRKKRFLEAVSKREISLLAVDEAHCASQWGNDFRPDYARISEFRKFLKNPVTIALTATATPDVQKDIIEILGMKENEISVYNEGIERLNINLAVHEVLDRNEKFKIIKDEILNKGQRNTIIYFNLIKDLEDFSKIFQENRIRHLAYHGKLSADRRREIHMKFLEYDRVIILATNAFGMGIDRPDIDLIIHADMPSSLEFYYQEIGRAGRDGRKCNAVLLYCQDDLAVQMDFIRWKNPDDSFIKKCYFHLKNLGDKINAYSYEDIQEQLVFKNRNDHRLSTVLNLFDRYHVTNGSLDTFNLLFTNELPDLLTDRSFIHKKLDLDNRRLYNMLQYAKTGKCRRDAINEYFGADKTQCGNCDNCIE